MTVSTLTHCYANGRPYIGLANRLADTILGISRGTTPTVHWTPGMSWPDFWREIKKQLKQHGYGYKTLVLYRQVLRQFRDYGIESPARATADIVRNYIDKLVQKDTTWSWIGANISVLRTAFDKIGGRHVTHGLVTPKRRQTLPDILSQREVSDILNAASTIRDQLMLGLMYGCGLKVGELSELRWESVDIKNSQLNVPRSRQTRERSLEIPPALIPVLEQGVNTCQGSEYIFAGRNEGSHLSKRMIELIVRKAAKTAQIFKPVCCMTLRHSYAVHRLEMDGSVRAVQESLGHKSIKTTLLYQDCILPKDIQNPLSAVRKLYPGSQFSVPTPSLPNSHARTTPQQLPTINKQLYSALRLPFRDETEFTAHDRVREFFQILKTQVSRGFLSSKKGHRPTG